MEAGEGGGEAEGTLFPLPPLPPPSPSSIERWFPKGEGGRGGEVCGNALSAVSDPTSLCEHRTGWPAGSQREAGWLPAAARCAPAALNDSNRENVKCALSMVRLRRSSSLASGRSPWR